MFLIFVCLTFDSRNSGTALVVYATYFFTRFKSLKVILLFWCKLKEMLKVTTHSESDRRQVIELH